MKIFGKLMSLVGGAILCLVVAFCIVGYFTLTEFGDAAAQNQLHIAATAMQKDIDESMEQQAMLSHMLMHDAEVARAVGEADVPALKELAARLMAEPSVSLVSIHDASGKALWRGHIDRVGDVVPPTVLGFGVPMRTGKPIIGLDPGPIVKLTLASGTPLVHNGETVGVIVVGMDLSSGDFLARIKNALDVEATIFLGDERISTTVMRDGKPVTGTLLNNQEIYDTVIGQGKTAVTRNMIAGKEYDTIYWPWKDLAGNNRGMFFVGLDRENIVASQVRVVISFVIAGLILGLVLMGAGAVVARAIARPLRAATVYAAKVSEGDFNGVISANSKDEVGTLVRALQTMVAQLKERLGFAQGIMLGIATPFVVVDIENNITYLNSQMLEYWGLSGKPDDYYGKPAATLFGDEQGRTPLDQVLKDHKLVLEHPISRVNARGDKKYMRITVAPLWDLDNRLLGACLLLTDETAIREQQERIVAFNERITLSVEEAHKISEQQADAFSQLRHQLDKTSNAAQAQTQASEDTMASISEMSTTLEMLAGKANQTREETRATRDEAEDGSRIVGETVERITQVAQYVERTEQSVQELGEQASSITHVVELIKDIADQTNLLALNAAIEAARAGEAGRGFAVVADEVRKLAEKTMLATNDVSSSVSQLQAEVEQNVELTHQTAEFTRMATDLAEKSGESLRRIVSIAENAVAEVSAIAEATQEQSHTGSAIARAMSTISGMARESVENMRESTDAVSRLATLSEGLKDLVDTMGTERRRAERYSVDSPFAIQVQAGSSAPVGCMLVDLSTTGLRLEAQKPPVHLKDGDHVTLRVDNAPFNSLLNQVRCSVAWVSETQVGLHMDKALPVTEDSIRMMVAQTQTGWDL